MNKEITTKEITLDIGVVVTIPIQFEYAKCKGCPADDIIWATTVNGRSMPIRYDINKGVWISHFSDCPSAKKFRTTIKHGQTVAKVGEKID
jgi:hypothetical protein